ncbi:hypothetical protein OAM18_01965 [Candidatus Pelagibacter sp.]|nr:hypothetical protein [Candidatus Pelagibacter sp.]
MRRGKLNKFSYLLIIISALFTVIAYVSDQLVIRYENNLRLNNFNYQNLDTEIKNIESVSSTLNDLEMQSFSILINELTQRNFWIKNLFIMESDKSYFKEIRKDLDVLIDGSFPVDNIKLRARISTKDLISNIINLRDSFLPIFDKKIFNDINFFSSDEFKKKLSVIGLINKNPNKFYRIKDLDDLLDSVFDEKYLDIELAYWWDLRNFRLLLTENLYNEIKKLTPVNEYLDKVLEDKILALDDIINKKNRINAYKNYFILTGIISQILTLFFLLLLFRSLIKQKIF